MSSSTLDISAPPGVDSMTVVRLGRVGGVAWRVLQARTAEYRTTSVRFLLVPPESRTCEEAECVRSGEVHDRHCPGAIEVRARWYDERTSARSRRGPLSALVRRAGTLPPCCLAPIRLSARRRRPQVPRRCGDCRHSRDGRGRTRSRPGRPSDGCSSAWARDAMPGCRDADR